MRFSQEKIKSVLESKSVRKIGSNFFYLSLLQIGGYIFPLITMPYLAHVIGVTGFGKIAFAAAIITYIQTVTDWGFNFTTTRDIARSKDCLSEVEHIYSVVTWARLLLMIISVFILVCLVFSIPYLKDNATIIIISLILIPGHVLFPEWLFQGLQEMKYITYLNFFSKLLFTCLIFLFIKEPSDYILQPLFLGFGYIVSAIIGIVYIKRNWNIKLKIVPFREVIQSIRNSVDVFINNLMPNFYNSFSVILLGFWGGPNSNGILDGANKFYSIFYQFILVISRSFFPFLATRIERHNIYAKLSIIIAGLGALLLFIFAPQIIHIFLSSAFEDSILVLRIISISLIFISISNIYGSNYLILVNCERQLRNATFIGSLIGLVISFPLIYYFDYIGAAITICVARGLLSLFTFLAAKKVQKQIVSI